jgi:hypothetical protein
MVLRTGSFNVPQVTASRPQGLDAVKANGPTPANVNAAATSTLNTAKLRPPKGFLASVKGWFAKSETPRDLPTASTNHRTPSRIARTFDTFTKHLNIGKWLAAGGELVEISQDYNRVNALCIDSVTLKGNELRSDANPLFDRSAPAKCLTTNDLTSDGKVSYAKIAPGTMFRLSLEITDGDPVRANTLQNICRRVIADLPENWPS